MMTKDDIELISHERVYGGYLRVDRYRLRHRRFDGEWTPPLDREVMERGHAAAVLPYDPILDRVVLQKQFRLPAHLAGFPAWQIEIPAGIIEPGENAARVARREAMEEAGCTIERLFPIHRYLSSTGCTTESLSVYCGLIDSTHAGGIHGLAEEHEDIQVMPVARSEAFRMLAAGEIANAVAIIALQWLALQPDRWYKARLDAEETA